MKDILGTVILLNGATLLIVEQPVYIRMLIRVEPSFTTQCLPQALLNNFVHSQGNRWNDLRLLRSP